MPPLVETDTVYVATNGKLYALMKSTGKRATLADPTPFSPNTILRMQAATTPTGKPEAIWVHDTGTLVRVVLRK